MACRERIPMTSSTVTRFAVNFKAITLRLGPPQGPWVSEDQGESWACVTHTLPPVYAVQFV
jgi:hypothetical protein